MEKRNILGIGTIVAAFIFSVIAITVAYAAYNRDLRINGTATAKTAKWEVRFKPGSLSTAYAGNDSGVTSTARELSPSPTLTDTTISTYNVELKTPGDYVYYDFIIQNSGDFSAKVGTFTMPTPTCTKGTNGSDNDVAYVCGGTVNETPVASNLEYTLTYIDVESGDTVTEGSSVATGDLYPVGKERKVRLKILYKQQSGTTPVLPTDDVTIGSLGITIPFVQN